MTDVLRVHMTDVLGDPVNDVLGDPVNDVLRVHVDTPHVMLMHPNWVQVSYYRSIRHKLQSRTYDNKVNISNTCRHTGFQVEPLLYIIHGHIHYIL